MAKVLYEKRDRIAWVTLNRPEARNAIDPDTHRLLWETWEDFRDDDALDVAFACDIRIASERAMFGSFEARRGYHHGDGGIVRLVNTCGAGIALEMLLTAEPIDAQRALQCNLVSKVVPHERLLEEAETVARQILRNSQRAVRSAKETILDVIGQQLDQQLRTEAWNAYTCADPDETLERLDSFYDKTDAGRAGEHERGL